MAAAQALRETVAFATETAMPHCQPPELSLVAVDPSSVGRASDRGMCIVAAGPGWFDSSWDLQRGLEVREDWSGEARLHGWIEDFLRVQRSVARTVSPSDSTAIA